MRKLIKTNGEEVELVGPTSFPDIEKMVGADTLCTVALRHLGHPLHVMLVDDNGYETTMVSKGPNHFEMKTGKARKPVNMKATELYLANCVPGTTHQIVGDVVIVPDEDFA